MIVKGIKKIIFLVEKKEKREMYSLYIPKYKGEMSSRSILPKKLGRFMNCTGYSYDLLVSPGYLSRTSGTIDKFLTEMEKELNTAGKRKVGVGLFHGMNGYNQITMGGTNVLCAHSMALTRSACLEEIAVDPKRLDDHRKMIFFFERNDWNITSTLDSGSMAAFLNKIVVKAVLIGSSNFSWNTYYDAGGKVPEKGEADLLMFVNEGYKREIQEIIEISQNPEGPLSLNPEEPPMVLSKSIAGGERPEEFFKEILKNFLEYSLN